MPTEPQPITLSQVVERAAQVADPEAADDAVTDFLQRFEDRDEPVTSIGDIEQTLAEAQGAIDPDGAEPQLTKPPEPVGEWLAAQGVTV